MDILERVKGQILSNEYRPTKDKLSTSYPNISLVTDHKVTFFLGDKLLSIAGIREI